VGGIAVEAFLNNTRTHSLMHLVILVSGGSGFVGRHVVALLEQQGHKVIVGTSKVKAVPTYADVIINLAGIIREDSQSYEEVHVQNTKWLLGLGKKLQVKQFIQMSALGARLGGTRYQHTKALAERAVQDSGLPHVIIRPSMIFGPDDKSINVFRRICRTGVFPVLGGGKTQPVHVDTVAKVILAAMDRRMKNKIVEIGGPEQFTLAQLSDRIHPGVHAFRAPRWMIAILTLLGSFIKSLPTREQVRMLGEDNVTKDKTVERLGISNPKLT
jgi:uncharacterized protein YbjT (DUF2867 family)